MAVQFDFGAAVGEPVWFRPMFSKMAGLVDLPPNWNSHGARPVSLKAIEYALNLLLQTMQTDTPLPTIVPLPRGGIQLEWHLSGIAFEVAVSPEGQFTLYLEGSNRFETADEFLEAEGQLGDIQETVAQALAELTARSGQ